MTKIRTALCSFGMSGRVFHAPFIQLHQGFELVGAWERSTKNLQHHYPNTKSYNTYDDLLNDDIDLVIINTPTNSHFELAKKALQTNKHIVVEKAFTTTVLEAQELQALAQQVNKKLAVFQNRRWDSDFRTVQQIINDGWLGQISEAEFHFDRFNLNLSPKKHKEVPGAGAGIVLDLGPHLIDQALCLFGMPTKVFADIRMTRPTTAVDDYFEILLYYPTMRARLKAGYIVQEPIPAYQVHGLNGSFVKPRGDVQESNLLSGNEPNLTNWGTENTEHQGIIHYTKEGKLIREKIVSQQGNYYHFYNAVYQSIVDNKAEPVTARDGINVMKIIEAAVESNKTERIVNL